MCRPLKDIVAELESKYQGFELSYDLEERHRVIDDFDRDIDYLFSRLEKYEEDVKFIIKRKLDLNSITRLTMNLAVVVQHLCILLDKYDYALGAYLMDERYETNHDLHIKFTESYKKIQKLSEKLQENNVFEVKKIDDSKFLRKVFYDRDRNEDYIEIKPQNFHNEEAEKLNGAEMMVCLKFLLEYFDEKLYEVKSLDINWNYLEMSRIFELNYLFYAKKYWPKKAPNFRPHIVRNNLKGRNVIDTLVNLRYDKTLDFEKTPTGGIWHDHSESKYEMARQMKDKKLDEKQWEYFFQNIFELEELDRWIDELRNPPAAKIKAAVLTGNKQFMAIIAKAVDQGLCTQSDWQYKWGNRGDGAYFASVASHKFELSRRHDHEGDLAISWKPFEALFGEKNLRSVYNDWNNLRYSHDNEKKIDKLFR